MNILYATQHRKRRNACLPDLQVSDSKEGPDSDFQRHIVDVCFELIIRMLAFILLILQAEVLITTPFHPGYLTADLFEKVSSSKTFLFE